MNGIHKSTHKSRNSFELNRMPRKILNLAEEKFNGDQFDHG